MNNDRIAEVYDGTQGTAETQRLARERIHWMCRQAQGARVLDIGCSQGIASLLLGREGKHVTGIDRESGAIEEAERRLAAEEEDVRERVRFVHLDALAATFPARSFDTVLLGEVIEHLVDPRPVLTAAQRWLKPDGRLVLTTPYGLFAYPDHKEPIYLGQLLDWLLAKFSVQDVLLLEKYLGIVAAPAPRSSRSDVWRRALHVAEVRLAAQDVAVDRLRAQVQRVSRDAAASDHSAEVTAAREAAAAAQTKADTTRAALERALVQLEGLCSTAEFAEQLVLDAEARAERLTHELGERERELAGVREREDSLRSTVAELEQMLVRVRWHPSPVASGKGDPVQAPAAPSSS